MWDMIAGSIRKTATEVLGVSRGIFGGRQRDWWWNQEVQHKVKAKKVSYTEWLECVDEEEKSRLKDIYKKMKTEAKWRSPVLRRQLLNAYMSSYGKKVRRAISRMKRGRATGPDEILVDFWKSTDKAGLEWLTKLFNVILKTDKMPDE
ncbi:uncharacterized protein LOC129894821 [Solanum dulcamara]|uniref:uncharacterized protein LOC129894821 n=1 Tax=Solanum dulcamara TaxID=45834 RepID=UPI0024859C3E|nr:uncharacterized protein LOC129894821 [Solanum dulcamara]